MRQRRVQAQSQVRPSQPHARVGGGGGQKPRSLAQVLPEVHLSALARIVPGRCQPHTRLLRVRPQRVQQPLRDQPAAAQTETDGAGAPRIHPILQAEPPPRGDESGLQPHPLRREDGPREHDRGRGPLRGHLQQHRTVGEAEPDDLEHDLPRPHQHHAPQGGDQGQLQAHRRDQPQVGVHRAAPPPPKAVEIHLHQLQLLHPQQEADPQGHRGVQVPQRGQLLRRREHPPPRRRIGQQAHRRTTAFRQEVLLHSRLPRRQDPQDPQREQALRELRRVLG